MMSQPKLTPEHYRILHKRITKALEKARYYPATVDPEEEAHRVLKPYQSTLESRIWIGWRGE